MKNKIYNRARKILEIAAEMADCYPGGFVVIIEDIQLYTGGYSEPGYTDPESGVIATGNWNNVTKWTRESITIFDLPSRILNLFEKLGIECKWSDEWCSCSNCGKLVRTSPDCYSWTPSYTVGDGELTCHECLKQDPVAHLESLEGNPNTANTINDIDPADYGYVKLNDESYETGYHPGQNDSPEVIAKELRAKGISRFLFQIDSVGQFDGRWSVYAHESEAQDKDE